MKNYALAGLLALLVQRLPASNKFETVAKGKTAVSAFAEKDYSCGNSFRFPRLLKITEFPFNSETNKFLKPTLL